MSSAVVTVFIDRPNQANDLLGRLFRPGGSKIAGSGIILTPDGLMMTSAHVVSGGINPVVRFCDGRESRARIVLTDERSDIAVLQIIAPPAGLSTLKFSAAPLQIGDAVEALGSPFAGEQEARLGTVKTLPFTSTGIADFPPFIETTTPLDPGYSGGPLLNRQNDIVGVNAAIYSHKGEFRGLSFAVPAATAERVLARARAMSISSDTNAPAAKAGPQPVLLGGQQPLSGASVMDLSPSSAQDYGVDPAATGVIVVEPGHGYADEAGFEIGDVIVSVDGRPATSTEALVALLAQMRSWTIEVLRGERRLTQKFQM